jgi:hypothetical protein
MAPEEAYQGHDSGVRANASPVYHIRKWLSHSCQIASLTRFVLFIVQFVAGCGAGWGSVGSYAAVNTGRYWEACLSLNQYVA